MRNIKLTIEYDGTNYAGWQIQNRIPSSVFRSPSKTIQEAIEKTLQRILQKKIKVIGSGRTDAGVHALGQVANFKINSNIALEKLQRGLNAVLPADIVVTKIEETDEDFHSRFSAKSKVYRYIIFNRTKRPVFLRDTVYFYAYPLNIRLMQREARVLLGRHNFKSFQATAKKEKNTVRTIKDLKIRHRGNFIYIDIEADGFLYNMVRNIVGTLIETGRGKLAAGSLKKILLAKNRKLAGPTAPSRGLCLLEVKY